MTENFPAECTICSGASIWIFGGPKRFFGGSKCKPDVPGDMVRFMLLLQLFFSSFCSVLLLLLLLLYYYCCSSYWFNFCRSRRHIRKLHENLSDVVASEITHTDACD